MDRAVATRPPAGRPGSDVPRSDQLVTAAPSPAAQQLDVDTRGLLPADDVGERRGLARPVEDLLLPDLGIDDAGRSGAAAGAMVSEAFEAASGCRRPAAGPSLPVTAERGTRTSKSGGRRCAARPRRRRRRVDAEEQDLADVLGGASHTRARASPAARCRRRRRSFRQAKRLDSSARGSRRGRRRRRRDPHGRGRLGRVGREAARVGILRGGHRRGAGKGHQDVCIVRPYGRRIRLRGICSSRRPTG